MKVCMTDSDLFELVMGSGATDYGWYGQCTIDFENNLAIIRMENGEMDDSGKELMTARRVDVPLLRLSIMRCMMRYPNGDVASLVTEDPSSPDFDATASDHILQFALFNEIIFA